MSGINDSFVYSKIKNVTKYKFITTFENGEIIYGFLSIEIKSLYLLNCWLCKGKYLHSCSDLLHAKLFM